MSPHTHGYSVYVHMNDLRHTVRLYRDVDDQHIHSWEDCEGLDATMRDVARQIARDDSASLKREGALYGVSAGSEGAKP